MVNVIIQLIIVLIICGFIIFCWGKLKTVIAQFIAEPFMGLIDVLIWILVGAIVVFYAIIPLIRALGGAIPHISF